MAISQKEQATVDAHLGKWEKEEQNHYQCPLVQEAVKKGQPALIGKILVLGTYRMFVFEKAKTGGEGKDDKKDKDKDKDKKKDKEKDDKDKKKSKVKKLGLGGGKSKSVVKALTSAVTKEKEILEIPYLDILMLEHNGKSKFSLKVRTAEGTTDSYSFRTDSTPTITEKLCHLRHRICGMAPPLKLIGPPLTFTEKLTPFVPDSPTAHYISSLPAWCNYYGVQLGIHVTNWIKMLEALKIRDLDLTQAPGFELGSDATMCIAPLILSLANDVYFKSLIIHDLPRRETVEEAAEAVRNNRALTKLVLVNLDGDAQGFNLLGQCLEEAAASSSIRIIDISSNKIGIGMDNISKALSVFKTPITYLNLSNCTIPPKQIADFFNAIKTNEQVSVNLEYLNLAFNKFDDETSTAFGNWGQKWAEKSKLRHLILAGTLFNFNSIVHLKLLKHLYELDISNNKIDTQLQLQCLWHFFDINPSVVKVSFAQCGFGQNPVLKDSSELLQLLWSKHASLPRIELNLLGNTPIGAMLPTAIDQAKNLTKLDITGVSVRDLQFIEITNALCKLTTLVSLKLDSMLASKPTTNEVGKALANIVGLMNLEELSVASGFGKAAIITMLDALVGGTNKTLKHLDISQNGIQDEGAEKLAEFLSSDKVLLTLKFDQNAIGLNGFVAVFNAVHFNKTLEFLFWPTIDIEELSGKLPKNKKDYFFGMLIKMQLRLQRFEVPPANGYFVAQDAYLQTLPMAPGADKPFSPDEELPALPDNTDDDPNYVSTINDNDDLVTASINEQINAGATGGIGGGAGGIAGGDEKSVAGNSGSEFATNAPSEDKSVLKKGSSRFGLKTTSSTPGTSTPMETIGESSTGKTTSTTTTNTATSPVISALSQENKPSTPRKAEDGDEAESGSAEEEDGKGKGAKLPANTTTPATPATPTHTATTPATNTTNTAATTTTTVTATTPATPATPTHTATTQPTTPVTPANPTPTPAAATTPAANPAATTPATTPATTTTPTPGNTGAANAGSSSPQVQRAASRPNPTTPTISKFSGGATANTPTGGANTAGGVKVNPGPPRQWPPVKTNSQTNVSAPQQQQAPPQQQQAPPQQQVPPQQQQQVPTAGTAAAVVTPQQQHVPQQQVPPAGVASSGYQGQPPLPPSAPIVIDESIPFDNPFKKSSIKLPNEEQFL